MEKLVYFYETIFPKKEYVGSVGFVVQRKTVFLLNISQFVCPTLVRGWPIDFNLQSSEVAHNLNI